MATQYFKNFNRLYYKFGDGESPAIFQNLTQYVDLIDQIKNNINFYEDYTIVAGDRPDTTSFRLYGSPEYYWTFFLLNDKLRESGWPISRNDILERAKIYYPHRVATFAEDISTEPYDFRVGRGVSGSRSETVGTIVKRNLSLGQLIIDTTTTVADVRREIEFTPNSNGYATLQLTEERESFHSPSLWVVKLKTGVDSNGDPIYSILTAPSVTLSNLNRTATIENVPYDPNGEYAVDAFLFATNAGTGNNFNAGEQLKFFDRASGLEIAATIHSETAQYNAVHHYEDADGNWVDINPYSQNIPSDLVPIRYIDRLEARNEDLKQIKVLKPEAINTVATEFYRLLNQ